MIYYGGQLVPVCGDDITLNEVTVSCRELGYKRGDLLTEYYNDINSKNDIFYSL